MVSNFVNGLQILSSLGAKLTEKKVYITVTHQTNQIIRETVFGINWDLKADTIILDFHELVNELFSLPMTKRSTLKISAKIFDSLGLI